MQADVNSRKDSHQVPLREPLPLSKLPPPIEHQRRDDDAKPPPHRSQPNCGDANRAKRRCREKPPQCARVRECISIVPRHPASPPPFASSLIRHVLTAQTTRSEARPLRSSYSRDRKVVINPTES